MTEVAIRYPNRLLGAILLISGTAIGAAMLALPVATGRAGLIPSIFVFIAIWLYLLFAALCLVELSLSMPKNANLLSMAELTLGKIGKVVSWGAYLFLLYALNTAYLYGMSSILHDFFHVHRAICAIPLVLLFAALLKRGVSFIDRLNRLFMLAFASSFLVLLFTKFSALSCVNVHEYDLSYVIPSFAIVLCAFGYHIVIPSLVGYLEQDVSKIKKAIWIGSAIPLVVYTVWQVVSIGQTAVQDQGFAFLAMITSFFGVSMALFDFLKDGCKGAKDSTLFIISFLPSIYFSLQNESIFLKALELAGAYGVVILLALLPSIMVWQNRYVHKRTSVYTAPGGKPLLLLFMAVSLSFMILECV